MSEYPNKLYKNVLLVDGKIVNWKTGKTHWGSVIMSFNNRQPMWIFKDKPKDISVDSCSKTVNSTEENNAFFDDNDFYKQYELHDRFDGFRPYK